MIGFEYICNLFNKKYINIAKELGITRQTINSWTSGKRKIPKKYIPILSEKFNVPQEYFQKEINDIDELQIQKIKLNNEIKKHEYEDVVTDPDTGEEITVTNTGIDKGALFNIYMNQYKIDEKNLLKSIQESLNRRFGDDEKDEDEYDYGLSDANEVLSLYKNFMELVNNVDIDNRTLKNILIGIKVAYGKAFGGEKFVRKIAKDIKEYDKENKKW
ncbi:helix-turn-helix domain-containing protein [Clostridium tyrobutyricum]|uniref:helix-turn-helix domain-containing protein n=1 Tax=Clostridium tyrobutyricum TaxID=1519 RepID=UPI001C38C08D|nr:helix-turn-helix domain-containing protein [Clostridium tyrobutyricum]MBV4450027.1 helix-turn-helix domain-containing protein [Clostridium tyrobutyricum]